MAEKTEKRKVAGKGLGKKMENIVDLCERYPEDNADKLKYPGAYKEGTFVLALMRDNIEWKLAEIYEIREAKFFKEEVNEASEEDKTLYDDILV